MVGEGKGYRRGSGGGECTYEHTYVYWRNSYDQ